MSPPCAGTTTAGPGLAVTTVAEEGTEAIEEGTALAEETDLQTEEETVGVEEVAVVVGTVVTREAADATTTAATTDEKTTAATTDVETTAATTVEGTTVGTTADRAPALPVAALTRASEAPALDATTDRTARPLLPASTSLRTPLSSTDPVRHSRSPSLAYPRQINRCSRNNQNLSQLPTLSMLKYERSQDHLVKSQQSQIKPRASFASNSRVEPSLVQQQRSTRPHRYRY